MYQKIKIFYYKFLLIFNIKTTLWNNDLNNICQKFLNKNKKIDKLYVLKNILSNKKIKYLKHYNICLMNYFVAQLLFEQIKKQRKIIFFPDEGIVQRIFILAYISNNINLKQIEKYFKYSQGKILINLISSSKKIDNEIQKDTKIKKAGLLIKIKFKK